MRLFLKHNAGYICVYLLGAFLVLIYSNLSGFIGISEILYLILMESFVLVCFLTVKYYKNKNVYNLFGQEMRNLNDSLIPLAHNGLGRDFGRLLKKQYNLYLAKLQGSDKIHEEHLTFINHWVHQMKTPLSILELLLKEFEGEEKAEMMKEELNKIEKGLNLALYYARLDSFQKDFVIKQINLRDLVTLVVNNNKMLFIKDRIVPQSTIDEELCVHSDEKWLGFILEQLLVNSIKYSKNKGNAIYIKAETNGQEIKLSIEDRGIGIVKKDLKRVFDPFFTGENGRKFGESTGMGLYIVKEVCDKLDHKITINSEINTGTTVTLILEKTN